MSSDWQTIPVPLASSNSRVYCTNFNCILNAFNHTIPGYVEIRDRHLRVQAQPSIPDPFSPLVFEEIRAQNAYLDVYANMSILRFTLTDEARVYSMQPGISLAITNFNWEAGSLNGNGLTSVTGSLNKYVYAYYRSSYITTGHKLKLDCLGSWDGESS